MIEYIYSFIGGIGDFFSCCSAFNDLEETLDPKETKVYFFSHFSDIECLAKQLPFEYECIIFRDNDDLNNKYSKFLELHKEKFVEKVTPNLDKIHPNLEHMIPESALKKADNIIQKSCDIAKQIDVDVVAIHMSGSAFSTSFLNAAKRPNKFVPANRIAELIRGIHSLRNNTMFYVFGSKEESYLYDFIKERLPKKCTFPIFDYDIWTSYAIAKNANLAICSDSAIKTLTCIDRIPTIVLLGDFDDSYRDRVFIDPYVKDNSMYVVKFKDEITPETISKTIDKASMILGGWTIESIKGAKK